MKKFTLTPLSTLLYMNTSRIIIIIFYYTVINDNILAGVGNNNHLVTILGIIL